LCCPQQQMELTRLTWDFGDCFNSWLLLLFILRWWRSNLKSVDGPPGENLLWVGSCEPHAWALEQPYTHTHAVGPQGPKGRAYKRRKLTSHLVN
jgi:hypothetical protein